MRDTKIIFLVVGNQKLGSGHIHRSIIYTRELQEMNYSTVTYYQEGDDLVYNIYTQNGLEAKQLNYTDPNVQLSFKDSVIILDILDTPSDLVDNLKQNNKVITFEDLGPGARQADLVINALYPEKKILPNHYFGHDYMELRDEFLDTSYWVKEKVTSVLITFGGTDPTNSTHRVLNAIYPYCIEKNIEINVVNGPGYQFLDSLAEFEKINVKLNVKNMAEQMLSNDLTFCSAGRTVYELACIGVPTIVLTQNERENHHFFATQEYGFTNLGLSVETAKGQILESFIDLSENYELRKYISNLMLNHNLKKGKENVLNLINKVINE